MIHRYRSILGNIHFTLDKTWGELIENDQSNFLPRLWYPDRAFDESPTAKLLYVKATAGFMKYVNKNAEEKTMTPKEFFKYGVDGTYTSGMGCHFYR